MRLPLATIITGSTLLKLVAAALVAGVGVTLSFSLLIYFADRASELRRGDRRTAAAACQAASVLALLGVCAIVAYGLVLTISKPK
jgi:hypothetical protein